MEIPIPNFAPPLHPLLYLLAVLILPVSSSNITDLLSAYPDFSDFTTLLTTTGVAADLTNRSSLTLLAVPNTYFRSSAAFHPNPISSAANIAADGLRCHVLLEYLSLSDLRRFPPAGKLVTTLFQTTGRAVANSGYLNITFDPSSASVTFHSDASNATMLSQIKTLPYNVSLLSLDSLLIPYDMNLLASETRPPLGLNITRALIDGHNFHVAASMLAASGVVSDFEAHEDGAGISIFAPTDEAFANLPPSVKFQSLTAEDKAMVLRFHVLPCYYTLGTLDTIVNPVQPTLATEKHGAGSFTLNISRVNGSVGINTGLVQASVTQTVFDEKPVSIFGVSKVLLPPEYFGRNPILVNPPPSDEGGVIENAQPPEAAQIPENSPAGTFNQPNQLSASHRAARPEVVVKIFLVLWTGLYCSIMLLYRRD